MLLPSDCQSSSSSNSSSSSMCPAVTQRRMLPYIAGVPTLAWATSLARTSPAYGVFWHCCRPGSKDRGRGRVRGRGRLKRGASSRKPIKTLPRKQFEARHTPFDFRISQWMSFTPFHSSYFIDSVVGFVHVHDEPIVHPAIDCVPGQPVTW